MSLTLKKMVFYFIETCVCYFIQDLSYFKENGRVRYSIEAGVLLYRGSYATLYRRVCYFIEAGVLLYIDGCATL